MPIQVDNYSDKEVQSCLDYYIDRLWIQNPAGKNRVCHCVPKLSKALLLTAHCLSPLTEGKLR